MRAGNSRRRVGPHSALPWLWSSPPAQTQRSFFNPVLDEIVWIVLFVSGVTACGSIAVAWLKPIVGTRKK